MRLLITGSSGFIGRNFIKHIKNSVIIDDWDIILLNSSDEKIEEYSIVNHKNYSFSIKDFHDKNINEIDVVLHMGAFIPKGSNEVNDIKCSTNNINNTIYLLENLPCIPKKLIYISTIDVYSETSQIIDESTPTIPLTMYGFSKLYCEKLIEKWALNNGVSIQIARLGHIYGSGEDMYRKLIPNTIRKLLNNEHPVIYTSGDELRSYIHIDDCCRLIFNLLLMTEGYIGPVNIVSSTYYSILSIVNYLIKISGLSIEAEIVDSGMKTRDYVFDNNKMLKYLGAEKIFLFDGLKLEYECMKENIRCY